MHMVEPLGIPAEGFELFFYVKEESRRTVASWLERHGAGARRLIAFAPGSKYVRKAWDARLFAATADWLRVNYPDFEIVVLRAPGEADAALRMIDAMERRKALLAPETSFNEAAAFVERSALLVCNDGGLNHLSVALGTPALAVFGSAAWSMWSAQGAAPYHYHVAPDGPYPAGDRSFGISAERVCDKLRAIMPEIARFTRTTAPGPAGPTPAMES
jgi:ADP-heptose:LPS heptosyltransferase